MLYLNSRQWGFQFPLACQMAKEGVPIESICVAAGVPSHKVILGKPASTVDANNGLMSSADLNKAIKDNYAYNRWNAGIMFWQFTSDINGTFTKEVAAGVLSPNPSFTASSAISKPSTPTTPSPSSTPSTPTIPSKPVVSDRIIPSYNSKVASSSTPVKFIYINRLTTWWGNLTVPAALAVPGFTATPLPFTHVALTFWTYPGNALDASGMWANIASNMGPNSFGTTNA
jgi:hypothetical protein